LKRIFKLCDTDKDNILNDNELNEFQVFTKERSRMTKTQMVYRENVLMHLYNLKN
jgi:hypothetical protein